MKIYQKIGVFDSGVGGLSVLKSLLEARLFKDIVYYGDTARVPYGVKDKETIVRFSIEAGEFFKAQNIDMLIVACNTVSAFGLKALRNLLQIPVLGVIDAGVLATARALKDKESHILVIATKATIKSKQYQKKLATKGFTRIDALATGLFVPMVEEGILKGEFLKSAFKYYFSGLKTAPDALILGCTHFPLISKPLKKYFGAHTKLIHSGQAIVSQLQNEFKLKSQSTKTKVKFYASSDTSALKHTAKLWLGDLI